MSFLKDFSNVFSPFLTKLFTKLLLFNVILNAGCYPTVWSQGIKVPIHKKGDVNNPDNYRGITLLSHMSKLFTSILNKRLLLWREENNIVSATQFGFKPRPGSRTRDAIFLHSLISKTLNDKKRLFCCFVDYTVIFSESVGGFQKMLDTLKAYTDRWKLEVNVSKTKMVVFEIGGKINSSVKC